MMRFDDDENKAWDVEYIVQSLPYLETTSTTKNNFKHNKSPEYKLRFFHLTSAISPNLAIDANKVQSAHKTCVMAYISPTIVYMLP